MRFPSQVGHLATGAATLAMLAGCAGAGSGIATPVAPAETGGAQSVAIQQSATGSCGSGHVVASSAYWQAGTPVHATRIARPFVDPIAIANSTRTVAVADAENNAVDAFDEHGTLVAEITGFNAPTGLASDMKGDLYVADSRNHRIAVIAPGMRGTPKYLEEPGQTPSSIDSFSNGRIVAAANFAEDCTPGGVTFFVNGVKSKTITSPYLYSAWFCAFDAIGNLYVDGVDEGGHPTIGEIAGGVHGTTFTPLPTTNTFRGAVGIQVTTSGQIAVADEAGAIYTYNAPSSRSLGKPVSTMPLAGIGVPIGFAFAKESADIYVADPAHRALQRYRYPAVGSMPSSTPVSGEPLGVALVPAQVPKVPPVPVH